MTANLSNGVAQPDGWGQSDSLENVENLRGELGKVNFTGDDGSNRLTLGDDADTADGMGGKDIIYGGLSGDTILGGSGEDRIYGEAGNDVIQGGPDNDLLSGGPDSDRILGNEGPADIAIGGKDEDGADVDYCDAERRQQCEKSPKTRGIERASVNVRFAR